MLAGIAVAIAGLAGGDARSEDVATGSATRPIARLDGKPITLGEVQPEIAFQVYRRRVDVYSLLRRATEELVERRLLEREAQRRGVSTEELLAAVTAGVEAASEADVDAYFEEHPEARAEPNAGERVRYYLTERRRIQARLDLVAKLRADASFELLLEAPVQPRVRVPLEGAPARGPDDAPVVVVHFAAFTSPRSARSAEQVRRLVGEFPGRIRWVHRSLPSDRDEVGLAAAQLAAAAHAAGRFWQVHDRAFALEGRLKPADLERIAAELELAAPRPGATAHLDAVKRDASLAARIGIEREPVLFVNGRYFSPTFPFDQLRAIVVEELGAQTTSAND